MDVTLEMSALAFLEQAEVKELVRPSQQSWLDSSRPTLITCSRVRPSPAVRLPHEDAMKMTDPIRNLTDGLRKNRPECWHRD